MTSGASLLAVFAHPDDESFRPGGTLALLARRGVRVQILTATRGQAGSRGNPPLLLDYQDGQLAEADPEGLIAQILQVVKDTRPQVMLTFGADGLSGHPDHIAIGQAAAEAFRRAEEVAALYTLAVPRSLVESLGMKQIRAVSDKSIALTVDVSAVWDDKMSAIRCHRTQLGESPILNAPEARQRLFLGAEHFCLSASRPGKENGFMQWLIAQK